MRGERRHGSRSTQECFAFLADFERSRLPAPRVVRRRVLHVVAALRHASVTPVTEVPRQPGA